MSDPRELQVFLLAQSTVNVEGYRAWLKYLGAEDFESTGSTPGELISEAAGRRCYLSFKPAMNPNVTRVREDIGQYLANILKVGHGCYDIETDVLTSDGWKSWPDVTMEDELATRTPDGVLEYHKPIRLIGYRHSGRMYRVESQQVDLLVTPDHKMLVCPTTTREGRRKASFELVPAEELGSRSHAYVKTAEWRGQCDGPIPPDVAALLGFSIGDGSASGACMSFNLRRERKIVWLRNLIRRMGWELREPKYRVLIPREYRGLFRAIYADDRQKQIPPGILLQSAETLGGLYEGLMQSDGSEGRTGDSFDTTSPHLVGQFQQLALHVGVAANVAYTYEDRPSSYGDKPLTRLSVVRRNLKPEVNKWSGCQGKTYWVDDWEGDVFCAEVPNNTLFVRRGGRCVWSGNSVLEHCTYTFAFEGLSRVATHELVRHRVGVAISQESLRYVRLTDLPFWLPLSIRDDPNGDDDTLLTERKLKTRLLFRETMKNLEAVQCQLADLWNIESERSFGVKKRLTSMFRRLAPIGLSTGMVWTANLRALRHVLTMRCDSAAEEEIYALFSMVLDVMREKEPHLFGDFENIENGSWVPAYKKV